MVLHPGVDVRSLRVPRPNEIPVVPLKQTVVAAEKGGRSWVRKWSNGVALKRTDSLKNRAKTEMSGEAVSHV